MNEINAAIRIVTDIDDLTPWNLKEVRPLMDRLIEVGGSPTFRRTALGERLKDIVQYLTPLERALYEFTHSYKSMSALVSCEKLVKGRGVNLAPLIEELMVHGEKAIESIIYQLEDLPEYEGFIKNENCRTRILIKLAESNRADQVNLLNELMVRENDRRKETETHA